VDTLIQACGACHNDVLDQSLSRARFSIDLSRMDVRAIQRAIGRIELPSTDPRVMPPIEARQLDADGRERLLSYLRSRARRAPVPAEPELERAAQLGMTGGAAEF
jgi:hypothetical protein